MIQIGTDLWYVDGNRTTPQLCRAINGDPSKSDIQINLPTTVFTALSNAQYFTGGYMPLVKLAAFNSTLIMTFASGAIMAANVRTRQVAIIGNWRGIWQGGAANAVPYNIPQGGLAQVGTQLMVGLRDYQNSTDNTFSQMWRGVEAADMTVNMALPVIPASSQGRQAYLRAA